MTIAINGVASGQSRIAVGGASAREFNAPIVVRRHSGCLGPGQHMVEVRWQQNASGTNSRLGNWTLSVERSASCATVK
jgi:hypothetical protein